MPIVKPVFSLGVFILAAGRSQRMGKSKLLLPWRGTSILGHLIRTWQRLQANHISIVIAGGDDLVLHELERLAIAASARIVNFFPDNGMFGSIQCAAAWKSAPDNLTHCAIVLGDQPHIQFATLKKIVGFAVQNPDRICQPSFSGRARHPVLLPKRLFEKLVESKATTLKQALSDWDVLLCECNDPGLDLDLDTPADYEKALGLTSETTAKETSGS